MPDERCSKGKGDIQDCRNHSGVQLMSYCMKIWENIIDERSETSVTENQFCFVSGKSSAVGTV